MSLTVLALAFALAADAFAVAIGKGLALGPRANARRGITVGLWFGIFQGLMPVIGWALASTFADAIEAWDHWIAFGLLTLLGVRMLWGAFAGGEDEHDDEMSWRAMLVLAVATSIDALAAGIGFTLAGIPVLSAALAIGLVTFALSGIGVRLGSLLGARWQTGATVAGGLLLVAMGVSILAEHTSFLA